MLNSKFLTATLAALTVGGSAGLALAQSSSTNPGPGTMNQSTTVPDVVVPEPSTTIRGATQPGNSNSSTGSITQGSGTGTQGTGTGTGTLNQGTGTMSQSPGMLNQERSTLDQRNTDMNQDRPMNDRLAARADRN